MAETCPKCGGEMFWKKEPKIISIKGYSNLVRVGVDMNVNVHVKCCENCKRCVDRDGRTPQHIKKMFMKILEIEQ